LTIRIEKPALESACKNIIETILNCLPNAFKGTVYLIGAPPALTATRVTSGIIDRERKSISWGLPERSDYNPPGKQWKDYRDQPGRPLEAMAWCVEKQKSWTAGDPWHNPRSVRLQVEGILEDNHHMEPVLVRKKDLYFEDTHLLKYPRNQGEELLWQDSDYVVVAVIKIHFQPGTIQMGSPETKLIKTLSRVLGTELLSVQLRDHAIEAMRRLAQDKLDSCNILADSLRNAIMKSGLIFSLVKLELGYLRDSWEKHVLAGAGRVSTRKEAIEALNRVLLILNHYNGKQSRDLVEVQNRFLELYLSPDQGENWIRMQIEERWKDVMRTHTLSEDQVNEVSARIEQLKVSLRVGQDQAVLASMTTMGEDLKREWTDLIYKSTDRVGVQDLGRIIEILKDPSLKLPSQEKSRKTLIHLKTLIEIMSQLEESTNRVLRQVLNGHAKAGLAGLLNDSGASSPADQHS
jgi:hypothetical protein